MTKTQKADMSEKTVAMLAQIRRLDTRLGKNTGAERERKRLLSGMAADITAELDSKGG